MQSVSKWYFKLSFAGLALLVAALEGQTRLDLGLQSKDIDFSSAATTKPFKTGTGLPSTCSPGAAFLSADSLGQTYTLYTCNPAGSWAPVGTSLGAPWNTLASPNGNFQLNLGNYSTIFTMGASTGTSDGFKIRDTSGNSGTGILAHFTTAAGSTAIPWQADANGVGWQIDSGGQLKALGTTQSGALTLSGSTSGSCTLGVPSSAGALIPGSAAECDIGSSSLPVADFYMAGKSATAASNNFRLTGIATGQRTWTVQDSSDVFVGRNTADVLTNKVFDTGATGNVFRINGTQISVMHGNSSSVLMAGTISGAGAALCTDASGNATTTGCSAAGVAGPVSSVPGNIPAWGSAGGNSLTGGFQTVSTLGNPGSQTALPTEAAVRAAISSSGGGTVSSVGTGCGLAGGQITTSGTISSAIQITPKASNYTVTNADCGTLLSMTGNNGFTIPAAGSGGFVSGSYVSLQNAGSGNVTVGTTGSSFYGGGSSGSALTLAAGQTALLISDGTNWNVASNAPGSGSSASGGGSTSGTGNLCAVAPASDITMVSANFATTCTIPANALNVGSTIDFVAAGTITGGHNNTYWGFAIKLGAATAIPGNAVGYEFPNTNTYVWEVRGTIVVTAVGTGGKVFGTAYMNQGNNTAYGTYTPGSFFNIQSPPGGVAIDTTASQPFAIDYLPNTADETAQLTLLRVQVSN